VLRTDTCGELTSKDDGKKVTLCGWVDSLRDMGQLFFIALRDRYGITQCIFEADRKGFEDVHKTLKELTLESVVKIEGTVRKRSEKDINKEQKTGSIEVTIDQVQILNRADELPFQLRDGNKVNPDNRLKYRYLDLRRPQMQRNLAVRHQVIQIIRQVMTEQGFLEIETPLLIRSTPEGARDFVVPSRVHPGKFYALPQSPQLYKQLLMVSGCDRYFQFAAAFRDEDLRADRVPVHTQIDMEMSFVEEKDVFHVVESYVSRVFKEIKGIELKAPFQIMPYSEAMERFGSDKPDLRFGLEIQTVTEVAKKAGFSVFDAASCIRCIVVETGDKITRKLIDEMTEVAKIYGAKGLAWTKVAGGELSGGAAKFLNPIARELIEKSGAKEGAALLFVADKYETCSTALGQVRLRLGRELGLINENEFRFTWINEFPLFEWDEERGAFNAMHHLFTMPKLSDLPLLDTDPGQVKAQLYDLVLNGVELLSGSIRINRPDIQKKVLDIVNMPHEEAMSKFGFLLEAFRFGAPPHGGSAMGLDRLVALLCGESSIREVIAYPCNNMGIFPLDGSPAPLDDAQLKELHLVIK
jgi:aspartyl-tRNA synthetase